MKRSEMSARWSEQEYKDFMERRNKTNLPTVAVEKRGEAPTQQVASSPSKYKNKKTMVDGIVFHSKREAARYEVLRTLERGGAIKNLRLQVPFVFELNDVRICKYFADFCYSENGKEIVEDAKGKVTKDYAIKRKMMRAFYAIEIRET
jgi:hypothetical protein